MAHLLHVPRILAARHWGGTETVVQALVEAAPSLGYAPHLLTTTALAETCENRLGPAEIRRLPYSYGIWPLDAARKQALDRRGGNLHVLGLDKAIADLPADTLVHLHSGGRFGAQVERAARRRGWPVVLTLHGGHFTLPPGENSVLQAKDGRIALPWGKLLSWAWNSRTLLQRVDAVICVGMDEFAAAKRNLDPGRVHFLPGGVDPSRFENASAKRGFQALSLPGDRPLIACLARLDVLKDQLSLVQAWAGLDEPCDLVCIGGESTPGYRTRLDTAAQGGPGRLICTGNVASTAIPDLLAAATLVVHPARYEPFGLAILEAWAACKPVLATTASGPAWILRDGGGQLVGIGDVEGLRAGMRRLLEDPSWAQSLVTEASRALELHTWQRRVAEHATLYERLLHPQAH